MAQTLAWRLCLLIAVFAVCDCQFHAEPPRQREDWSDPPSLYGNTSFQGLRSPAGKVVDAGAD